MGCLDLRAVDDDGARGDGDGQDDHRHQHHVHRRQGRDLALQGIKQVLAFVFSAFYIGLKGNLFFPPEQRRVTN